MTKLLQINTIVNLGSTGKIVEELGIKVKLINWESYIAFGRDERPSESKLIKIGNNFDINLHGLLTRFFDKHGFGSYSATIKLIQEINKIKPDIIHLHNIHGYYINIDILFKYLSEVNIPVVWTLHDCWAFTGHCTHFELLNCLKWKTGCYSCPQKKEYPKSILLDRSRKNYIQKIKLFTAINNLTIVTVSKWLENHVKSSFLKLYPTVQIYNGIDITVFNIKDNANKNIRKKIGVKDQFIILGVASVWTSRKGFNDFIKLSKFIDSDCIIVLVGLTKKQLQKLPHNIIGISKTENVNELAEIYSSSNLFANLTYEDNFPTTNIESLACGTPVLTYNTGGSIEAISKETGFIVEKGDLNAVLDVIKLVKCNGKSAYTSACRDRAISLYNKDDRYMEYLNLYETLLSNKNSTEK